MTSELTSNYLLAYRLELTLVTWWYLPADTEAEYHWHHCFRPWLQLATETISRAGGVDVSSGISRELPCWTGDHPSGSRMFCTDIVALSTWGSEDYFDHTLRLSSDRL